ncbi:MAG TPA: DUF4388 domain-containing protein [Anaeromyxobacter sp.]|nr:DUF4388 domain-containing protein [Anaeromyxobacter sp.]
MSRILLVDDDIAEISAVKRVLARAGHQPGLATNASDATAAMSLEQPELIIVSSTCENGEALALARSLRGDPSTASIPVLVLGEADDLPEGARRLSRPVDPEQLAAETKAALPAGDGIKLSPAPAAKGPGLPAPGGSVPLARVKPARPPAPPAAEPARPARTTAQRPSPPAPPRSAAPPSGAAHASLAEAAASRRAAADALRARAEELRRSAQRKSSPPDSSAPAVPGRAAAPVPPAPPDRPAAPERAAPALILEPPPSPRPGPDLVEPAQEPGPSRPALTLELDDGELEAALEATSNAPGISAPDAALGAEEDLRHRAAEDALRALEEETGAPLSKGGRHEGEAALAPAIPPRELREAVETARREAYEAARRELAEQAKHEAAEAARLVQAEARARQEAVAAAQHEAEQLARRQSEAEERARAAELELTALRSQLDEERRKAEDRVATVMQRAAKEEAAAEELRRMAEDEIRRRDEEQARSRDAEEEKLRAAIAGARAEMEALRQKNDEEARRRTEAEAALERLEKTRREEAERAAAPAEPAFTPPPFFAPFEGAETAVPPADPAEETARRRVAALRTPPPDAEPPPGRAELDVAPPPEPGEPTRIPPPPPQLRAGDLSEIPAPRLLSLAARARLGGRIDVQGEVARSLYFEAGRVVGVLSADPSERLEEVALRTGLITRDQHRQIAQAAAALPSRRAALLLLERGFLKATELTSLVRRRTEEVVFGVMSDEGARFRWAAVEVPPEERTALERGALALAVEGVRRRFLAQRVDALLGGAATLLAPMVGAPGAAELGLSPEERRIVSLADGLRTLDEIVQASPLDALSTRQVLAALVLVGALSIRVLQAGRVGGQAAVAIDLARVKEKLEQVRRADYFTVLGVGRLCTPHEVREAADRLLTEFEPGRFAALPDEGLPARLAEIHQVVRDAREVLSDDRLRDEYLRGLGDAG